MSEGSMVVKQISLSESTPITQNLNQLYKSSI